MATKRKKKKSFPKQPKASASLAVWKRYLERCKAVKAYNLQVDKDSKEKEKIINDVKKFKQGGSGK